MEAAGRSRQEPLLLCRGLQTRPVVGFDWWPVPLSPVIFFVISRALLYCLELSESWGILGQKKKKTQRFLMGDVAAAAKAVVSVGEKAAAAA